VSPISLVTVNLFECLKIDYKTKLNASLLKLA
jgi:hypothetical protein